MYDQDTIDLGDHKKGKWHCCPGSKVRLFFGFETKAVDPKDPSKGNERKMLATIECLGCLKNMDVEKVHALAIVGEIMELIPTAPVQVEAHLEGRRRWLKSQ
jgi:hypothetical protein